MYFECTLVLYISLYKKNKGSRPRAVGQRVGRAGSAAVAADGGEGPQVAADGAVCRLRDQHAEAAKYDAFGPNHGGAFRPFDCGRTA